jgi:hypothetical protein
MNNSRGGIALRGRCRLQVIRRRWHWTPIVVEMVCHVRVISSVFFYVYTGASSFYSFSCVWHQCATSHREKV